MPYVSNDLQVAEQRVRELRVKLEQRRAQANAQDNFQGAGLSFRNTAPHIAALYKELSAAASIIIAGRFDPLEVLDKMGWK